MKGLFLFGFCDEEGKLPPTYVDPLNISAMACPALPLCPLAITEAERGIPDLLKRFRSVFEKVGLPYNESIVVRVTGCLNGCARLYMAELGLVGDGPNSYQIWLGGTPAQTSLARTFMNKVKIQDLEKVFEPLIYSWKLKRKSKESFGDFTNRVGFEKLEEIVGKWEGVPKSSSRYYLRLFTDKGTYEAGDSLVRSRIRVLINSQSRSFVIMLLPSKMANTSNITKPQLE